MWTKQATRGGVHQGRDPLISPRICCMSDISLPIRSGEDFIESGHATCIGGQPEQPDRLRRLYPVLIGPDRRNDMAGKSLGLNKHRPPYMDPYQDHNKVLESKTNV